MPIKCPNCSTDNPDTQKFCGECASPLLDSSEDPISHTRTLVNPTEQFKTGTTIAGRYKILEELGKGGMGQVYRVKDIKINEEMALKLVRPEVASDASTIERFQNELKLARKITHKNVCRLHDFHEEEDLPFITMEYVEGKDLKSLIRNKGKLTEKSALSVAQQVCEGLAEAHELGVIHRDLKPQNIMIDDKGRAKIMDFGIARSVEAHGVTKTGVIIGTPDYISPEQADGKDAHQRSDIYSLGVILYEMMTGQVPFTGDTALSLVLKHKSQYPLDPRKLNPEISDDLSRVILVCMEKDSSRRYPTATALLTDLRNIEEGFPLGTKIRPRRGTFISSLTRKKLFIPAVVSVFTVLAVIFWQLLPQRAPVISDSSEKPSIAVLYFKNNTGDQNFDIWQEGLSSSIITDLSQSKHVRVLPSDRIYSILKRLSLLETQIYATEDLQRVAQEGDTNYILQGSLSKAGSVFRMDYTLQNIHTGEIEGSNRFQAKGEESFFVMVDQLTNSLKSDLGLSADVIASDPDSRLGKISTSSPEAYKYYLQGRRLHHELRFAESIEMMEKAIKIDPEFAMAYRSIFVSSRNTAEEYLQKAFELSQGDRVSLRERLQIQGQYYHTGPGGRDRIKALEILQRLLDLYPDDPMGNQFVGYIYMNWEQWEKALKYFEVLISQKDETYYAYNYAAQTYSRLGEYKKAQDILEIYLKNYNYYNFMQAALSWTHVLQGDYERAFAELEKILANDPENPQVLAIKGKILVCKGDFKEAEALFEDILERKDLIPNPGMIPLYDLYLLQGKFTQCENMSKDTIFPWKWSNFYRTTGNFNKALEEAKKHRVPQIIQYLEGMIYVDMGSLEKAQEAVKVLADTIEKEYEKNRFSYWEKYQKNLMGRIELARKNFPEAIELFEDALSSLSKEFIPSAENQVHAVFMEPLARAYYESGNLVKAAETYRAITELTLGRLEFGDIYTRAFCMLGKIYEEQGDKNQAIANYEKFLEFWKDADPGLTEVEDAKKRLRGLTT